MKTPRLSCQNLSFYKGKRAILRDISLDLDEGEVICLLGPSGCGKSSTLRLLSGIETPSGGEIYIDGQLVAGAGCFVPAEKRHIGMMFQDFALFPNMNVRQNIAFSGADSAMVDELLMRIGLKGRAKDYPHQLSGGEQQRVALARSLAAKPRVLLMDEPFSGLDDRLRDQLREGCFDILKEIGASVIMVTHDPSEAMRVADQIALMRGGEAGGHIVQIGAPYNIYNNPVDEKAAAFFSDINVLSGVVENGLVNSPFGYFLTPGFEHGEKVDIVIRPQHLKIDFDRNGTGPTETKEAGVAARGAVVRARFLGRESLVEFKMDFEDLILQATVPAVFLPPLGTKFWLSVRRDRVHVFAHEAEGGRDDLA